MSLPFFASLRATLPEATLVCSCRPSLTSLFESVSDVDRVLPLDESRGRSGLAAARLNAACLREENADCAFSLPSSFGSALMLWLARIPKRIGHAAEGRGMLLTHSLPYGKNGDRPHRTEGYLSLLELAFPNATITRELKFQPNAAAVDAVHALWSDVNRSGPILALGPGAAQPNKMWVPERFAAVAKRWIDEIGGSVIFVGSAAERERTEEIKENLDSERVSDYAGAGNIAVAGEIIRRADVFVGNDSGLVHLAAAAGTKTVAISGPGDPAEVSPFSPLAVTVKHPLFCSPCYKNVCWRKDKPLECLTAVQVDHVWEQVVRHMSA
jgi:heptosyltransferase-2